MKLILLFTVIACTQAGARGYGQSINLHLKDVPLEKVFASIEKQGHYHFIYTKEELENITTVTIDVKEKTLAATLELCFKDLPLTYRLQDDYIIIRKKDPAIPVSVQTQSPVHISGKIVNDKDEAIAGATVTIKGTGIATACNDRGEFVIEAPNANVTLVITSVGYKPREVELKGAVSIMVRLETVVSSLDETIVMAYGNTTKRLSTGNISKVTAEEISQQPVSNPLAALEGRVPGLVITQSSGVPGSSFKIQIEGQQSVGAKGNINTKIVTNDPLIIIDGVPFAAGNSILNQLNSAAGSPGNGFGLSPLNLINPSDIESIEVLKDADATAIYGSRGANGVILITTKKGKAGKTKFNFSAYTGASKVTRTIDMLNTQQYVQMRREGLVNDGLALSNSAIDPGYAPDLLYWDTTKYTDWKKYFIGGTAKTNDMEGSVSGGNAGTQFLVGGGVHHETTVFPGDQGDTRYSAHFNLNHQSPNKKFTLAFNTSYSSDINNLASNDLTTAIGLIPNLPGLIDNNGKLKWDDNGIKYSSVGIINPLSYIYQKYKAEGRDLLNNLVMGYKIFPGLILRSSFGYNTTDFNESRLLPLASLNPSNSTTGSASFGNLALKSWIIEPQAEFTHKLAMGKLTALVGASWQNTINNAQEIDATGYTNDNLLGSISAAGSVTGTTNYSDYRYAAVFGRLNYDISNKYILNLSGRRDGSSRFGPGNQFANFGAAGLAWIFTEEKFLKGKLPFLSFGKLKASYGTTGNDQIGDYKYLSTWGPTSNPYQSIPGLAPTRLANPDFAWEINKKLQASLDLGFIHDRVLLSALFFRNRSGNQLVTYPLPTQTGFSSLATINLPAIVQNKGWEFTVSSKNIQQKDFTWTTDFNLTIGRNKLVSFPGMASTSYATTYVVGQSLNLVYKYQFLGVDPATGLYKFNDVNNDGAFNTKDYVVSGNLDPKFYGGLSNTITYKNAGLSFLVEFKKQTGSDYRFDVSTSPGYFTNQPLDVLDRWQKNGDMSEVQKFSANSSSAAFANITRLIGSNGAFSDASYIRLKNVAASYKMNWFEKWHIQDCRLYIQCQNLVTWSGYRGADPETQSLYRLPPLRTITGGIQLAL